MYVGVPPHPCPGPLPDPFGVPGIWALKGAGFSGVFGFGGHWVRGPRASGSELSLRPWALIRCASLGPHSYAPMRTWIWTGTRWGLVWAALVAAGRHAAFIWTACSPGAGPTRRGRGGGGGGAGRREGGANYWAPLTRKRHIPPHPAQPRHWAPRTRKRHRHQQEHRPQWLTERSDPTQHAKGRTGDCPGPRKETATRRNVTQAGGSTAPPPTPARRPFPAPAQPTLTALKRGLPTTFGGIAGSTHWGGLRPWSGGGSFRNATLRPPGGCWQGAVWTRAMGDGGGNVPRMRLLGPATPGRMPVLY